MSVLIFGMEMPTNCLDCKLCYDAFYCRALGIGFYVDRDKEYRQEGFDPETARLQGCPLVPVPPHGDLIDKQYAYQNTMAMGEHMRKIILKQIDLLPTVISAEEGET